MKSLTMCAMLLMILSACETSTRTTATATEAALCQAWGQSLPTRSRQDTEQTQDEIATAYATFAAACPNHEALIP